MGSFTDLEGVYAGALASGIKQEGLDLSYIYIPDAVGSAGVFTQNRSAASSIFYTQKCLKKSVMKAVLIHSGNANACTGKLGMVNTKRMGQIGAQLLNLDVKQVGIAGTGIIGVSLPMDIIQKGLTTLLKTPLQKEGQRVSEAILTTDLTVKQCFFEQKIGKKNICISGITKGSGMFAPNMATTLSFMVTNASLNSVQLQRILAKSVSKTFNMASVDTDTSTNDMLLCFSTGQYRFDQTDRDQSAAFQSLMDQACLDLTEQLVRDGEGASKLIRVTVKGAVSLLEARLIAKSIINSPLVKTAIHGEDSNWGRVLMAAGKETVRLNPDKVSLYYGEHLLLDQGVFQPKGFDLIKMYLKQKEVNIVLDLHLGQSEATAYGCDLSKGYIDINTAYN